jgi:hypothetical protein
VSAYRSRPLPGRLDADVELTTNTTFSFSPELIELATIRIVHAHMASASIAQLREKIQRILDLIAADMGAA